VNLWRLEILRLARTKRWLALAAVYLLFGVAGPLVTRYQEELFRNLGGDVTIIAPEPDPAAAIAAYVQNASQIGFLVSIFVAAGALTLHAWPEWAAFLRTRVAGPRRLLTPRFVINAAANAVAFAVGALVAWYETTVLIGAPSAFGMVVGIGLGALYLTMLVAVVALAGAAVRGVLAAVGVAAVVLLLMPLLGTVGVVRDWMPSRLVGAMPELAGGGSPSDFALAAAVAVAVILAALWGAVRLAERHEL
jgi:ABC-2 type transport system permease protein